MNNHLQQLNQNTNPTYMGLAIIPGYTMIDDYLAKIKVVLDKAITEHPRTFVVRFDLHLPIQPNCVDMPNVYDSTVISRFVDSFKAHVKYDLLAKKREGKRVHDCTIRYIWTKEKNESQQAHYHVALLLNHDTYFTLGNYDGSSNNLVSKIYSSWASALGIECFSISRYVHFPQDIPTYFVNINSSTYISDYNRVFYRLSYFAKLETKVFGTKEKNFGYSLR
ncbi:inovirus Gp2 family protein [Photobacterium damselae]|uniref:inovirus Gp2 family protein n=2 Tax=Gammaproteobacteria TaxID=1236 RepID=UPI00165DA5DC|nr:inovirus Gp2 family protein [Photobacterium damselae]MCG3813057.1 inovirus Gp2 family protein [Photobacterium damselae]